MTYNARTTVQDIADWMNHWLKVQRTTAERYKELPTVFTAYGKFADAIRSIIQECGQSLKDEFRAHASWENELHKGQDIWMRTLCFFDFAGEHFYLLAWVNGERRVLLDFHAICKDFADGDDQCHAVVSIETPEGMDGSTTVYSVLSKTAWEQFELEPDVLKRWMAAPEEFTCYYAICPVCGAAAHHTDYGGCGYSPVEHRMTCDYCDWVSHKQYQEHDTSRFTDKKGFAAEVKYAQKKQRTENERQEALASVKEALQKLESMWKSHKYTMSDEEYRHALDRIQNMVETARRASRDKH